MQDTTPVRLYRTLSGNFVEANGRFHHLGETAWDEVITRVDVHEFLQSAITSRPEAGFTEVQLMAPIGSQEVWAAGVTYYRSRDARITESKDAGGGAFYDRVYSAERPELFFKASPHRVAEPQGKVKIRRDATWSVPEPELALLVSPAGKIVGYTVGNDMSSRDIEGENPLYLPQAKVYDRSCALGPGILVTQTPLPPSTEIHMEILRAGRSAFSGSVRLEDMKRDPAALVEYLFRDNSFPNGCFLLTGTGIVPPDSLSLKANDEIRITIAPIGILINYVA